MTEIKIQQRHFVLSAGLLDSAPASKRYRRAAIAVMLNWSLYNIQCCKISHGRGVHPGGQSSASGGTCVIRVSVGGGYAPRPCILVLIGPTSSPKKLCSSPYQRCWERSPHRRRPRARPCRPWRLGGCWKCDVWAARAGVLPWRLLLACPSLAWPMRVPVPLPRFQRPSPSRAGWGLACQCPPTSTSQSAQACCTRQNTDLAPRELIVALTKQPSVPRATAPLVI